MRIASLVPSSTEMVFELGLGDDVVAVTHECDWPPEAASLPHLTRTVVPEGLSAAEIDRTVRETVAAGRPLYELDRDRLEEQAPDLIVTQAVCDVCAVSYDDVVAVAATLPGRPRVLSLDPCRLTRCSPTSSGSPTRPACRTAAGACARSPTPASRRCGPPSRAHPALAWRRSSGWTRRSSAGIGFPEMIDLAGGRDVLGRRRRAIAHGVVGGDLGGAAAGCARHAVRLRRGALRGGGAHLRAVARRRSEPTASWPWTPPPTSRARARGW